MTAWSEELSRARATLRLSQREVATRTGISEAAYNVMDLGMTYQYRGFGVPGL